MQEYHIGKTNFKCRAWLLAYAVYALFVLSLAQRQYYRVLPLASHGEHRRTCGHWIYRMSDYNNNMHINAEWKQWNSNASTRFALTWTWTKRVQQYRHYWKRDTRNHKHCKYECKKTTKFLDKTGRKVLWQDYSTGSVEIDDIGIERIFLLFCLCEIMEMYHG